MVCVDLVVMAMKGYSTFHKAQGLKADHQMQFRVKSKSLVNGRFYHSAEMQPAYSTTQADSSGSFPMSFNLDANFKLSVNSLGKYMAV